MTIISTDLPILADLLGQIDCLHMPPRGNRLEMPARAVVDELQMDFARLGLPVHVSGTVSERKIGERLYRRLENRGLVKVYRRQNRVGVRLVDEVEWSVRSGFGFGLIDCLEAMVRLMRAEVEGLFLPFDGIPWMPEGVVAGVPWNWNTSEQEGRIIDLQDQLAGALCRRWAIVNSGTNSRAWYALTTVGRYVLENPPKIKRERRYSCELNDVYEAGVETMNRRIATGKLQHVNHLGVIPLPATAWCKNEKLFSEFRRLEQEAVSATVAGNGKANQHP